MSFDSMNQIKIACLPIAGIENPYQSLMIGGLNSSDEIDAFNGVNDRFFGIIKTWYRYNPDFIHFDWISSYYRRRNLFLTILLLPLFFMQISFIVYLTSAKIVWTAHNLLPHDSKYPLIDRLVRKYLAKKVEWIRVFSKTSIKRFKRDLNIAANKIIVVPEGDYTSVYKNDSSKIESRIKIGVDNDKFVMLYMGFIKPYKGLEELINAFLRNQSPQSVLIIAGKSMDNSYLNKIKGLISENKNIKLFDEFIPPDSLQYFFNCSDIVVLPFNKIENSGSVIMAMGFSKAILAPKMGVIVDRLSHQEELLYDNLENGIRLCLQYNSEDLERTGKNNYDVLSKYNWKDFSNAFNR